MPFPFDMQIEDILLESIDSWIFFYLEFCFMPVVDLDSFGGCLMVE